MKRMLLFLIMLFSFAILVVAEPYEYEYLTTLEVSCENYKGYVEFDVPSSFNHAYMEGAWWVYDAPAKTQSQPDWYLAPLLGVSSHSLSSAHDESMQTVLLLEGNEATLSFNNPSLKTIDSIHIDLEDSLLDSVDLNVPFTLSQNGFHYELKLDSPIIARELDIDLKFSGLVKIKEVTFFQELSGPSKKGYFYVDNNCNELRYLYHGNYGDSNFARGMQNPQRYFEVTSKTQENPDYLDDFDSDLIVNENDNCPYISNPNQEDINYNGIGDFCEDDDLDGVANAMDNCPNDRNQAQNDEDSDGIGDACDEEDNRFFEENAVWAYVIAGIIIALFFVLGYFILKEKR